MDSQPANTLPHPNSFLSKTVPYQHQIQGLADQIEKVFYAMFWEMGTGKSKTLIDCAANLAHEKKINGLLIIADKGLYMNWKKMVEIHWPDEVPYVLAWYASGQKKKDWLAMEELLKGADLINTLHILLMNVESFSGESGVNVASRFLRGHARSMMVIDESTSIKNIRASRTRNLIRLGRIAAYRRILTGTPITQNPLDLYSQCEFLAPKCLGFPSWTAFRAYYAIIKQQVMGSRVFPMIVGYRCLDTLARSVSPFSTRITKAQCLSLPDKIYETWEVEQTSEQKEVYQSMKDNALALINQDLVTAPQVLTMLLRLHQINCGHVTLDDGTVKDIPSNRIKELQRILEIIGNNKVVIWCRFQRDVEQICTALSPMAVSYYGKDTNEARLEHLKLWQNDPKCLYFVGTQRTGGKGLTMVEAHHVVYYSLSYSLEDRLQSEDRVHRIGQTNKVTYVDMVCPGTIDEQILKRLRSKQDLARMVVGELRGLLI